MLADRDSMALRRPLVGVAVCVIVGMVVGTWRLLPFVAILFISFCLLCSTAIFCRSRYATLLVFLFFGFLGAARFEWALFQHDREDLSHFFLKLPASGTFDGAVADVPQFYAYSNGGGTWLFPLRCDGVQTPDGWKAYRGTVTVRVAGKSSDPPFYNGERIRIAGLLNHQAYPATPGRFSLTTSPDQRGQRLAGSKKYALRRLILRVRESGAATLGLEMEGRANELAVSKALLLGYRDVIPPDLYQIFKRTGTMHIFAISGLHVGIVALLLIGLLKACGISRQWRGLFLLPTLLLYVMATGMKSSALRATVMASIYFLSPLLQRRPDVPSSVAFAALLLLFINPLELFSIGFIFSFAVVSFIVMLFSVLPTDRWYFIDHFQLAGTKMGQGLAVCRTYVLTLSITSIAAFIASIPLSALMFNGFTPIVLFSNLAAVPLTFLIVLTGWLSMFSGFISPFLSAVFNHATAFFIASLLQSMAFFARIPGGYLHVQSPPLIAVFLWFCGWILLFTHARTRRQRRVAFALVVIAFGWGMWTNWMA